MIDDDALEVRQRGDDYEIIVRDPDLADALREILGVAEDDVVVVATLEQTFSAGAPAAPTKESTDEEDAEALPD